MHTNSKSGVGLEISSRKEPAVLKHIGYNDLIGFAGLVVAVIAVAKTKGIGDTIAASVGAVAGLVLAVTSLGTAIHAGILDALNVATPNPSVYDNWYSIGPFGVLALVVLIVVLILAKGVRMATVLAFLGTLLFVASTGLGQLLYNIIVGH